MPSKKQIKRGLRIYHNKKLGHYVIINNTQYQIDPNDVDKIKKMSILIPLKRQRKDIEQPIKIHRRIRKGRAYQNHDFDVDMNERVRLASEIAQQRLEPPKKRGRKKKNEDFHKLNFQNAHHLTKQQLMQMLGVAHTQELMLQKRLQGLNQTQPLIIPQQQQPQQQKEDSIPLRDLPPILSKAFLNALNQSKHEERQQQQEELQREEQKNNTLQQELSSRGAVIKPMLPQFDQQQQQVFDVNFQQQQQGGQEGLDMLSQDVQQKERGEENYGHSLEQAYEQISEEEMNRRKQEAQQEGDRLREYIQRQQMLMNNFEDQFQDLRERHYIEDRDRTVEDAKALKQNIKRLIQSLTQTRQYQLPNLVQEEEQEQEEEQKMQQPPPIFEESSVQLVPEEQHQQLQQQHEQLQEQNQQLQTRNNQQQIQIIVQNIRKFLDDFQREGILQWYQSHPTLQSVNYKERETPMKTLKTRMNKILQHLGMQQLKQFIDQNKEQYIGGIQQSDSYVDSYNRTPYTDFMSVFLRTFAPQETQLQQRAQQVFNALVKSNYLYDTFSSPFTKLSLIEHNTQSYGRDELWHDAFIWDTINGNSKYQDHLDANTKDVYQYACENGLSNDEIDEIMNHIHLKPYVGTVFGSDISDVRSRIMKKINKYGEAYLIVNENSGNEKDKNPHHWYSIVIDAMQKQICVFDSEKIQDPIQQRLIHKLVDLIDSIDDDGITYKIKYNKNILQKPNTKTCGLWAILFLIRYSESDGNFKQASFFHQTQDDNDSFLRESFSRPFQQI